MKKRLLVISMVTVTMMLSGCCLSHDWKEATCTQSKTCVKCEETEGEALGHTWANATCSAPKTCNTCGLTEGDALEHTWVEATCSAPKTCSVCSQTEGDTLEHTFAEANYQQASTCNVCGTTEGEPLEADYAKNGMNNFLELNVTYDYVTQSNSEESYPTTGKITFSVCEDDVIEGEFEELEGYEWQVVTATIVFYDNNAREYGVSTPYWLADYYNIVNFNDNNTINYNGVDYTECKVINEKLYNAWNIPGARAVVVRHAVRVPVGYDGIVINYFDRNSSLASNDMETWYVNDVYNENTLSFRMSSACSISDKTVIEPITADNLTVETAWKVMEEQIKPIYTTILEAEEAKTFFDIDKDGTINDEELDRFLGWVLVHTDDNGNSSIANLTDDEVVEYAQIWLTHGTVDNPDYMYYFENGEQIMY